MYYYFMWKMVEKSIVDEAVEIDKVMTKSGHILFMRKAALFLFLAGSSCFVVGIGGLALSAVGYGLLGFSIGNLATVAAFFVGMGIVGIGASTDISGRR